MLILNNNLLSNKRFVDIVFSYILLGFLSPLLLISLAMQEPFNFA